ncbi:MAG: AAA family ATPase [Geminicoccaceae bacterium]|nr:AAA family ATPase [Geminicoccaceae bacterium]
MARIPDADEQAEVLAFLEGGGFGGRPERIDTHAAVVLLVGERAYKLKKAVRFSFLDFTTRERRRAALEAELVLNRRTAPALYRRLVPVTREEDGGLALDGGGRPVEWLLEMVRFPDEARLDRIAERGGLDRDLAERLGQRVARFHARAAIRRDKGGAAALAAVVRGNASDLRELVPELLPGERVERACAAVERALAPVEPLLEARRLAGLVRHGHGDLHLANIVALDGEPTPFDCLEFDEDLACTDLLYDLAFLLMDLLARGLEEAARTCLQAWADARLDDQGLALLPLLIAIRAQIRAKVEGFTARAVRAAEERARHRTSAQHYLEQVLRVLEPRPVRLVAIAGRSGTGKSSIAAALAPALGPVPGALVLRSDVVRKRSFGRQPEERLAAEAYRPEVTRRVFAALAERAGRLAAAGRAVVCDAVYGLPEQRAELRAAAERAGVPFTGIWLEAPEEVLEARVAARRGDASDADVAIVRRQAETVAAPSPEEGWLRIDASGTPEAICARVRAVLAGER